MRAKRKRPAKKPPAAPAEQIGENEGAGTEKIPQGDVSADPAAADPPSGDAVTRETRAQATNRWVLEGRRWDTDRRRKDLIRQGVAAGLTRSDAGDRAWDVVLAEFPPPGVAPTEPEPAIDPPPVVEAPVAPPPAGVVGLGDIPAAWPSLPPNASLAAEVGWVQASRVDVVEVLPGGGARVHLDRAATPAPSKASLAWLETSILYGSMWAGVCVKATSAQQDEQDLERRERKSIAEVRALLAEMIEGEDLPENRPDPRGPSRDS